MKITFVLLSLQTLLASTVTDFRLPKIPIENVHTPLVVPAWNTSVSTYFEGNDSSKTNSTSVLIDSFFLILKSFISDTEFDVARFEPRVTELGRAFSELDLLVKSAVHHDLQLMHQFVFTSRMFAEMERAAQRMRTYDLPSSPVSTLLYQIIEINVRALALYHSDGTPALETENYTERVHLLLRSVYYWGMNFQGVEGVTTEMQHVFDEVVVEAEQKVEHLASFVGTKN